jgi:hypothetical protein
MKRILTFALIVAVAFSVVVAVQAKPNLTTDMPLGQMKLGRAHGKTIDLDFQIEPSNLKYFRGMLLYEGAQTLAVPGKPQVPFFTKRLNIPNGWTATDVLVTAIESKSFPLPALDHYVPKTWSGSPVLDEITKEQTGIFPDVVGGFKVEHGADGQYVALEINPVLCDFDIKLLRIAINISISITLEESFEKLSKSEDETKKSVILCKAEYMKPANRLAEAHKADKYVTEVVTLESIATKYTPQEEEPEYPGPNKYKDKEKLYMKNYDYELARKIRAYLAENIENINYLTIMGDGLVVPPSFYQTERRYFEKYDKYIPTDLFYSSPDLDTVPNMAVGRLPVRNVDEAEKLVSRIITYRKAITKEKAHSISFAGGDPFSGGFDGELDCQSVIEFGYADGLKISKYYKTLDKFDSKSVMDALKNETGFIYTISHGSGDAIYTEPGKVTTADLMSLPKRDVAPIIFTPSCTNGMYDASVIEHKYEQKGAEGLSWGQACLLSEGGPIAYFGGSRVNYAGVNWIVEGGVVKILPFTEMDRLMQDSFGAYANWAQTLGDMYTEALSEYIGVSSDGFFQSNKSLFAYTLLGDPTIKLPPAPGGQPHKQPDVKALKCPMTGGRFSVPILSIADEATIIIKTDAEWIKTKSIDLENDNKATEEKKLPGSSEKNIEMKLKQDQKSFYQMRVTLPNHSEVWMYYISRANFDLSTESNRTFFISEPGKTEYFHFGVFNDGTKSQENIEVKLHLDGKLVETKKIKKLEKWYGQEISFKLRNIGEGEHELKLEVTSQEKDQFPKDNTIVKKLTITKEETAKGGVLVSYFFNRNKAKEALGIEKYNNEGFKLGKTPTEIATIGNDSYMSLLFGGGIPDLTSAGCDTAICVTPDFANPYVQTNYTKLEQFMAEGGQVIGMGCLYSSKSGPNYALLAEMFGFKKDLDYEIEESETKVTYNAPNLLHLLFDKLENSIEFGDGKGNKPSKDGWEASFDKAKPIAWSADKLNVITENARTIYISSIPKISTTSQVQFMHNLLMYNLRPQKDAAITSSDIEVLPPVLEVGGKGIVACDVQNLGNVDLDNVTATLLPLNKSVKIDRIKKGKSQKVEFEISSPDKQSIANFKVKLTLDGDIDIANNEVEIRVQAMEKNTSGEATISDLSILDGQLLPYQPTFLEGKTQPNATVSANGYCSRADDKGRFSLYLEPTDSTPLPISIKGVDGKIAVKNLFVAYEKGGEIGGVVDKKYLVEASNILENLTDAPVATIENDTYLNVSVCQNNLNVKVEISEQKWTLKGQRFSLNGSSASQTVELAIEGFARQIELTKKPIIKDGKLLISLQTLVKLYFGIEQNNSLKSYKIVFPVATKPNLSYSPNLETQSPKSPEDKLYIPSESDYGPAKLISYGSLDGEVAALNSFSFGSKHIYMNTSRGMEKWTKDGKFESNLGLPKTLSKDLDVYWYRILHGSSYRSSTIDFIATNTGFVFGYGNRFAIYDTNFKLVKMVENKEDGFDFYLGMRLNSSGSICVFNRMGNLLEYDANGSLVKTSIFKDKDGLEIEDISDFAFLPNGKTIILISDGFMSLSWSIYLYDKDGNIISSKVTEGDIEDILEDSEDYQSPPGSILTTQDGTIWFVNSTYTSVSITSVDESFNPINTKVISEGYTRMKAIAISPDGVFYMQGSFVKKSDDGNKIYHLAYLDKDYKQVLIVPAVELEQQNRFLMPYKMIFDPNGNLLLLDGERAKLYDKTGNFKENLEFSTEKGGNITEYNDLYFDGENYLILIDNWGGSIILIADKDKKVFKTIYLYNEEFHINPSGIASDLAKNEIYILDSSGQILVINSYLDVKEPTEEVTIVRKIGAYGFGQGKMANPVQMIKKGDRFYILDVTLDKYLVFETDGKFLFEFGGEGEIPGKFQYPVGIGVDDGGLIWTIDLVLSKIQVFTAEGAYLAALGYEGSQASPGTVRGYKENAFGFLSPIDLAIGGGQMAVFDYGHSRIYMVGSLERSTNFTIMPPELSISTKITAQKASTEFFISNTGPGTLSYELTCEDKNVKITPGSVKSNFVKITVELDISMHKPETIKIMAKGNMGETSIEIPVTYRPINAVFALEPVASSDEDVVMLSRTPEIINDLVIFSSNDIEKLISLSGTVGKDTQTLYYTFKNRKIGFKLNSSVAELIIDGDSFNIDLNYKVSKLKDGGYSIPLKVVASFLSCDLITKGKTYRLTSR